MLLWHGARDLGGWVQSIEDAHHVGRVYEGSFIGGRKGRGEREKEGKRDRERYREEEEEVEVGRVLSFKGPGCCLPCTRCAGSPRGVARWAWMLTNTKSKLKLTWKVLEKDWNRFLVWVGYPCMCLPLRIKLLFRWSIQSCELNQNYFILHPNTRPFSILLLIQGKMAILGLTLYE